MLHTLQTRLNFSTSLYKRKEAAWGMIYPQPNGTYHGTGMIGDIFFKRADLAVAPLSYVTERAHYVDYLPSIKHFNLGIYISKASAEHTLDLLLFISPFAQETWMLIGMTSVIISLVKLSLHKYFGKNLE